MGFHKWRYPSSWMIYKQKSYSNGWFRDTLICGNPHIVIVKHGRYTAEELPMPSQLVAVEAADTGSVGTREGEREPWQLDTIHSALAVHLGKSGATKGETVWKCMELQTYSEWPGGNMERMGVHMRKPWKTIKKPRIRHMPDSGRLSVPGMDRNARLCAKFGEI